MQKQSANLNRELIFWPVGGGRGVKEKNGVTPSAKEKNEAIRDGVSPSVTVTSRNSTGTQEANLVKIGHDNLHDVNARETPSNFTANTNKAISEQFANTAYGFFLGKRVAYLVVANYVRNTWGKYGLVKSMLNSSTGIFSFQISSTDGLDAVVKNGPCEDGSSAIATKLGTLLMLDFYTSDMCIQSWGRSSYARALIEVRADVELKDNIVVAMPKLVRDGFYMCNNVRVEYEWKPPKCACCKVLGHIQNNCPKNIDSDVVKNMKKPSQAPRGVLVGLKVTLVDDQGKPLTKVDSSGNHDSEDKVASVDNDMTNFLASKKVG
ncbi:hypothetical protein Tco_0318143 [Tanacetum coccineum]